MWVSVNEERFRPSIDVKFLKKLFGQNNFKM